jgi:fumarate hydratase, class II
VVSYVFRDLPVGIEASGTRRERDSIGAIDVPADRYWGAQTQRALIACPAPIDAMPERFYRCYGYVKRAAATVTQLLGRAAGRREPVDPVRDVNMNQSLGGTFTASTFIATVMEIEEALVPHASALADALDRNPNLSSSHGYRLRGALGRLDEAEGSLHEIGADPDGQAMAPGITGEFWHFVIGTIATDTARPFVIASEGWSDRSSLDAMIAVMTAVRGAALVVFDIAGAVRAFDHDQHASPRPLTEAIAMICMSIIGQDHVVAAAACRGNPAASVARPLLAASVLKSVRRLGEACKALRRIVARV